MAAALFDALDNVTARGAGSPAVALLIRPLVAAVDGLRGIVRLREFVSAAGAFGVTVRTFSRAASVLSVAASRLGATASTFELPRDTASIYAVVNTVLALPAELAGAGVRGDSGLSLLAAIPTLDRSNAVLRNYSSSGALAGTASAVVAAREAWVGLANASEALALALKALPVPRLDVAAGVASVPLSANDVAAVAAAAVKVGAALRAVGAPETAPPAVMDTLRSLQRAIDAIPGTSAGVAAVLKYSHVMTSALGVVDRGLSVFATTMTLDVGKIIAALSDTGISDAAVGFAEALGLSFGADDVGAYITSWAVDAAEDFALAARLAGGVGSLPTNSSDLARALVTFSTAGMSVTRTGVSSLKAVCALLSAVQAGLANMPLSVKNNPGLNLAMRRPFAAHTAAAAVAARVLAIARLGAYAGTAQRVAAEVQTLLALASAVKAKAAALGTDFGGWVTFLRGDLLDIVNGEAGGILSRTAAAAGKNGCGGATLVVNAANASALMTRGLRSYVAGAASGVAPEALSVRRFRALSALVDAADGLLGDAAAIAGGLCGADARAFATGLGAEKAWVSLLSRFAGWGDQVARAGITNLTAAVAAASAAPSAIAVRSAAAAAAGTVDSFAVPDVNGATAGLATAFDAAFGVSVTGAKVLRVVRSVADNAVLLEKILSFDSETLLTMASPVCLAIVNAAAGGGGGVDAASAAEDAMAALQVRQRDVPLTRAVICISQYALGARSDVHSRGRCHAYPSMPRAHGDMHSRMRSHAPRGRAVGLAVVGGRRLTHRGRGDGAPSLRAGRYVRRRPR